MALSITAETTFRPWSEEPSATPGRRKIRARIGGLHCSLCTGTIEKAVGRMPGVDKVAVSLTHEQALIEYDPAITRPELLLGTLRDIGYTISDPRKLRPFEEEERELVREGRRFVIAVALSVAAIPIIADPWDTWIGLLPAIVCLSLGALVFLVLRSSGIWAAVAGACALGVMALSLLYLNLAGYLTDAAPWLVAALAVILVFGVGRHILHMAFQALRRGILNQHVLLEIGAFAGLAGGVIGLILDRPGYPTAPFFAVSVMVGTYHIFSEWLSLIVKTRSSQAVKRLLDLQPETARVVRGAQEVELTIEQVKVGDIARIRPGERVPVDGTVMSGHSGVDQSLVTGEALPIEKSQGDPVIGGSINGTGTLGENYRGGRRQLPAPGHPPRRGRTRAQAGHPASGRPGLACLHPRGSRHRGAGRGLLACRLVCVGAARYRAGGLRRPERPRHGLSVRGRHFRAALHRAWRR